MLLGLGLADGLEEVQKLIGNVDGDHSGKIEFEEFIEMIQD
jgi:Ca2+-binding EF-hand superfamily protein